MTPYKKPVAEKLRHYREACVLSQKQVADALNIERSTYTKYETGDSEPNLTTIVKLAAIYNISPVELLPEVDSDSGPVKQLRDTVRADSPIYQLNKEERGLLAYFRVLDKEKRKEAIAFIGNLSKKS